MFENFPRTDNVLETFLGPMSRIQFLKTEKIEVNLLKPNKKI